MAPTHCGPISCSADYPHSIFYFLLNTIVDWDVCITYFMLLFVCLGITFLIQTFRTKDFKHFLTAATLALVAVALSAGSFAVILLPTSEYAKETMRGGRSEL